MNVGLIFAGGVGTRMNSRVKPKQFLELHGKPIIIYTIEHFERHADINYISIACVESWIDYLKELIEKYHIKKVKWIVPGGSTGQISIYNALKAVEHDCPPETIVLIHDGVRPLIDESIIRDNIECVKGYGSAITCSDTTETVIVINDVGEIQSLPRNKVRIAKAPQSFYLRDILEVQEKALAEGNNNVIDSCTLMNQYGKKLAMVSCPSENIKITTAQDYYIFRTIYECKENAQIFGY